MAYPLHIVGFFPFSQSEMTKKFKIVYRFKTLYLVILISFQTSLDVLILTPIVWH